MMTRSFETTGLRVRKNDRKLSSCCPGPAALSTPSQAALETPPGRATTPAGRVTDSIIGKLPPLPGGVAWLEQHGPQIEKPSK
eukprot:637764-Rhodomonas_salina.3